MSAYNTACNVVYSRISASTQSRVILQRNDAAAAHAPHTHTHSNNHPHSHPGTLP
jgi:hypothetical protein